MTHPFSHNPPAGEGREEAGAASVFRKVAQVAHAVGWQANVPGTDIAGLIVSFLAANPEHADRFMAEGSELFVDGTIKPEAGCLSYLAGNGATLTPAHLRQIKGIEQ